MKKLSLVIALGLAAISAQAATVSFQFQFPAPALTNTEINQSGVLGLFDTNLGTLTDVELVLNSAMAGAITLSLGPSTINRNISGTSTSDIFFTSSLAPLNAALGAVSQNLSFTTGFINLAPGDSQTTSGLTDAESTALNAALDPFIASFGTPNGGGFNLGCSSLSSFTLSGGGGFAFGGDNRQAGCGAMITYTYSDGTPPLPVPEPGSLALVALALAIAGASSRRKA